MMNWKGKELKEVREIIDTGLALKPEEQDEFVDQVARLGPYALQNIGYFSGYYDAKTAAEILRVFRTAHPIFGTRRPTPEEALEAGKKLGEEMKERRNRRPG